MHSIVISEFINYDSKGLYEYIMLQNESHYRIMVEKQTTKSKDEPFDIFWEYYQAAYMGQELFLVADAFAYYVPSIHHTGYFRFDVTINDPEKFAETLYYIIAAYYDTDDNTSMHFNDHAAKFFDEAYTNEDLEVGCWGLLDIANRHLDTKPDNDEH